VSASLITALTVMSACQLYKVVVHSIQRGRPDLRRLLSTGGMPSTHTAFVTALAVSVAFWRGVAGEHFAITSTFAAIIVYDSIRVRGMVDLHTRILRDLQARVPGAAGIKIPRWVGHTVAEVAVGLVLGAAGAVAGYYLLRGAFPGGVITTRTGL
jgi:acid phosphatase family membrane protein YuiD